MGSLQHPGARGTTALPAAARLYRREVLAAGSLTGGVTLENLGPGALPWIALPLITAALVTVAVARRHAFPAARGRI
ncbi:hypothetical protein [Streptomyces sp. NBC_00078]|uniref:hypothetical protein n=1 Tax=Streptomyces sp. NBC_00078 TaxID=2975643 RepID=UPI002251ECF8|nr:hypothetical protein [Streptomyces sp. NBC_00078]